MDRTLLEDLFDFDPDILTEQQMLILIFEELVVLRAENKQLKERLNGKENLELY